MATLNTSNGAQSNKPKYLVLLDMKGTICYRTDESVGRARHDLFIRRKFYYKRLGVNEFVLQLHATGMFDICVYSSMMAHNIEAGLNAIMPHRRLLRAVLDREMNKPDPAGINEWDTVRDMKKVWNRLPGYGPERTLLLDNEARKFQDAPENGIVVPEFGPAEVLSKKSGTLDTLLQYLLDLARDAPKDVPPAKALDATSAVDSLLDNFAAVSLGTPTPPKGTVEATRASRSVDSSSPSTRVLSATSKKNPALAVPRGTSLQFVCVQNGRFMVKNQIADVVVRGPADSPLRIDAKMDFHGFLEDAKRAGVDLSVRVGDGEEVTIKATEPTLLGMILLKYTSAR